MIYLDYSATTKVDPEILKDYINSLVLFPGNCLSTHKLGTLSKEKLGVYISYITRIFKCKVEEIIFTSGASESNATAIRGVASSYSEAGKHIITSPLEHKSVLEEMERLKKIGYEVDTVDLDENGLVDLNHLRSLIRKDTILISICAVNSEVGYIQDLNKIRRVMKEKESNAILHSDFTGALGKINVDLSSVDLASFSSHKIYAPMGCGILYKKENIILDSLISPTGKISPYRGGTPAHALICAFCLAIKKFANNIENENKCKILNKIIIDRLSKYPVHINSNDLCVPQIINFSLLDINSLDFVRKLSEYKIFVSTTTACCSGEVSTILKYMYDDKKIYKTPIRISISHLTTIEEIEEFFKRFDEIYNELKK